MGPSLELRLFTHACSFVKGTAPISRAGTAGVSMAAKMLINIQLGLIFLLSAPGSAVLGCVVLQLHFSGLAANLNGLLASLPAFDETNGTVYIDNAMFPYKCSDEGGLFDFFVPGLLQPYTGTIQQQQCRYYIFDKMRDFAREIGVAFCDSKYDPAIVHKVGPRRSCDKQPLYNHASVTLINHVQWCPNVLC